MEYLGHTYKTATASYTLRDGRPCKQQTWKVDEGEWHTQYIVPPFTVSDIRDDVQDHGAEAHIRDLEGVDYKQVHGHGGYRPGSGRPPVDEKRSPRTFKATDAEWKQIQKNAKIAGMNTSEYIRSKTLAAE